MKTLTKTIAMLLALCAAAAILALGKSAFIRWRTFRAGGAAELEPAPAEAGGDLAPVNERLRAETELLRSGVCVSEDDGRYIRAYVYAEYPWSLGGTLVVNRGSLDGIKTGMPVVTESKFLLGEIVEVRNRTSEVRTVFDGAWKSSVALGEGGVKAVLKGGIPPRVEMVPKEKETQEGMIVANTDTDYPLYQLIGETMKFTGSEDVWKEAPVSVPYDIRDITAVLIRTDFP